MVGQGGVPVYDIKRRPVDPRACSSLHWVHGGWGLARDPGHGGPNEVDSGRVADPKRAQRVQGGKGVKK